MSRFLNAVLIVCLLFSAIAKSQNATSTTFADTGLLKINHTTDFVLTGDGKAASWSAANWVALPCYSANRAGYKTQIKVLYSDSGIYCLYRCEDKKITATLKEDFADLYREDVVEVFLRSNDTIPLYFEYELSPLNYELAILIPNIKGSIFGWRPWHYEGVRKTRHEAHIDTTGGGITGWTAEIFIPYPLLRPMTNKPPKKGDRWRANFYRIDYDSGSQVTWQWNPVRNGSFHDFERFGLIEFN